MESRVAGPEFAAWLTRQLAVTGISRRQLAQLSGVDHSTISRLTQGRRMPTLETAAKLARVLPEAPGEEGAIPRLLSGRSRRATSPVSRVEYALRDDDVLSPDDIRAVMSVYLAKRAASRRRSPDPRIAPNVRRIDSLRSVRPVLDRRAHSGAMRHRELDLRERRPLLVLPSR